MGRVKSFQKQALGSDPQPADIARVFNQQAINLQDLFRELALQPGSNSVLLQKRALKAGTNRIAHSLGHALVGWQLTRLRANVAVWDAQDSEAQPDVFLSLVASAPVVVDLLVF
jgi:hypothetical protein